MACCAECNKNASKLLLCGACKQARYCCKNCQISHWKSIHKKECKRWILFDEVLFEISKDERTGFMEPKCLDDPLWEHEDKYEYCRLYGNPLPLPSLLTFLNPQRYLNNIIDFWNKKDDDEKNNRNQANKFEIAYISPCQEVFGIMQYLMMCAAFDNNFMSFFYDMTIEQEAKQNINKFISNKNSSEFSMLFILIGLSQFKCNGDVHYVVVVKLHNKFRIIQSFGWKLSLQQHLKNSNWMNSHQIKPIMDAFIYLHYIGIKSDIKENDIKEIKINSMTAFGFELEAEMNKNKRGKKHNKLQCSIMSDLSFKRFAESSKHLIRYLDLMCNKFKMNELNFKGVPLCYRMGYPDCLDDEYLKKVNKEQKWGYKIK